MAEDITVQGQQLGAFASFQQQSNVDLVHPLGISPGTVVYTRTCSRMSFLPPLSLRLCIVSSTAGIENSMQTTYERVEDGMYNLEEANALLVRVLLREAHMEEE